MLFRILEAGGLRRLVEELLETTEVVGPRRVATGRDGRPVHHFLPIDGLADLDLDYETTEYSAKTYFLPFRETLSTFAFDEDGWEQAVSYRLQPRALFGLHACDVHALLKLDAVLVRDLFPSPYYLSRRKNTFVVGIDHRPCRDGFCRSLGTDSVTHGFDLFLTDLGDRHFVAVGSERGFALLQRVGVRDVAEADTQAYLEVRHRFREEPQEEVDVRDLPKLLDLEFESAVWDRHGARCMSCGTCAMVCPTCYCYGVAERVSLDGRLGAKTKQLYSCSLIDFASVAGGHNFRPGRHTRLKYRYYHQHRGFLEAYDEPKCVGCGRCGRSCVAGIRPPDVIRDLQTEDRP